MNDQISGQFKQRPILVLAPWVVQKVCLTWFGILMCLSSMATSSSMEITYYHANHLGGTLLTTDQAGTVTNRYAYAPYGEQLEAHSQITEGVRYTFAGKERDASSGLMYFEARYYNPHLGRFQSADPGLGGPVYDKAALNRYAYAGNNPVNLTDPTGFSYGTDANGNPELPGSSNPGSTPSADGSNPSTVEGTGTTQTVDDDPVLTDSEILADSYIIRYEISRTPMGDHDKVDYSESIMYVGPTGDLITHNHHSDNATMNQNLSILNFCGSEVSISNNAIGLFSMGASETGRIYGVGDLGKNQDVSFIDETSQIPVGTTLRIVLPNQKPEGTSLYVQETVVLDNRIENNGNGAAGAGSAWSYFQISTPVSSGYSGGPVFWDTDTDGDGDLETVLIGNVYGFIPLTINGEPAGKINLVARNPPIESQSQNQPLPATTSENSAQ